MDQYKIVYRSSKGMLCVINYDILKLQNGEWVKVKNVYNHDEAVKYVNDCGGTVVSDVPNSDVY